MPVGFCSPKDELPNPKAFAPLFPNKLEESGEMKNTCEAQIDNILHYSSLTGSGEGETSVSPRPQAQNDHCTENSTLQREATFSPVLQGFGIPPRSILAVMDH